jgi:hypothetical protein
MLQVFYLDVVYTYILQAVFHTYICKFFYLDFAYVCMVFKCFSGVFTSVSDACFKCFICLFYILQLLYLDVSKVDRVLHMAWEAASNAGDVHGSAGPLFVRLLASSTR